ncbi:MAG: hypothetical protein JNL10_14510 [Verrucomicrobiales bacterium]|nr:hypothetical protein [Verrucomicrobiales bacterium]
MHSEPDSLQSVLTSLAADAVGTQRLLDAGHAEDMRRMALELPRLLAAVPPVSVPDWMGALLGTALPARLQVVSMAMSLRCELRSDLQVGVGVAVRPLNLGYEARFGSAETWATQLQWEVTATPAPPIQTLSKLNHLQQPNQERDHGQTQ